MSTAKTMSFVSMNPATERVEARFEVHSPSEVDAILDGVQRGQRNWSVLPTEERAFALGEVGAWLTRELSAMAELITAEMGKPIVEAEAEVAKCARTLDWLAENGWRLLEPQLVELDGAVAYVQYQPLGVLLAIMPWNYPLWQFFRAAAPALLAGNSVVLKHASNVPRCAIAIESAFRAVPACSEIVRSLLIDSASASDLIADSRIAGVTLTGSSDAGSQVAKEAGRAIKKCVLELGGSDPFIVLADADVEQAAKVGCTARFRNAGQTCVAAKRFLVEADVADEFIVRFEAAVSALRVGDPRKRSTSIGPLARRELVAELERQLEESKQLGAVVTLGGTRTGERGYYFSPTVVTDVTPEMPLFFEETFGPVAAITVVGGPAEALRLANETQYGLGASIWSRHREQALTLARQVEAGAVYVNGLVASDPRLPFGGVKRSGFGRELADVGLREFTNVQTAVVA